MQISTINTAFKANITPSLNPKKIYELEQKRESIKWGSEGCNGDLNAQDSKELELRIKYQQLLDKHAARQWGTEGCNGGLSAEDIKRMSEIRAQLLEIKEEPKQEQPKTSCDCPKCNSTNPYGVPDSTFYGDWAR